LCLCIGDTNMERLGTQGSWGERKGGGRASVIMVGAPQILGTRP